MRRDILRDDVVEAIRVDEEEGNVDQETKLCGEVPNNIDVIKVDAGDDIDQGIVRHHSTEDTMIVAHIRVDPIVNEVVEVGVHCLLSYPQSNIGTMEVGIGDGDIDLNIKHEVIREASLLQEDHELTVHDRGNINVGEGQGKTRERREAKQDSKAFTKVTFM